jgi:hypothetical protein
VQIECSGRGRGRWGMRGAGVERDGDWAGHTYVEEIDAALILYSSGRSFE